MVMVELALNSALSLPEGKMKQYYNLLKKGCSDDDSLINTLYAEKDKWSKQKFKNLKVELKKRMVAGIASMPYAGSKSITTHIAAHQSYAAASILIAKGLKKAGIDLMERAFRIANKTHVTSLAILAAKELALHYAVIAGDQKKYSRYKMEIDRLIAINEIETKAQFYYTEISSIYNHKWKVDGNVKNKALTYASEIKSGIEESTRISIYYFNLLAIGFLSENEHNKVLEVCEKATLFFNDLNGNRATRFSFLIKKIAALIELKRYEDAVEAISISLQIVKRGTYNYHVALFYRAIIGLHTNATAKTKEVIEETKTTRATLPYHFQEQWKLVEAYAYLLSSNGFRIGKFINEVPKFSKDKAGANTAIIIVQMLHLLKAGRTNDFIERCEAIEQYSRRYLSGRSRLFVKMLLQIPEGRFNVNSVQLRVKKLITQMEKCERKEIEIVPYEVLWNEVRTMLK